MRIEELALTEQEQGIVKATLCSGKWKDDVTGDVIEWMDSALQTYLEGKRDLKMLVPLVPQLASLLDRILRDRLGNVRLAAEDVRRNPPRVSEECWPLEYLPTVERVVAWAFAEWMYVATDGGMVSREWEQARAKTSLD
jgi:hypothetical protein